MAEPLVKKELRHLILGPFAIPAAMSHLDLNHDTLIETMAPIPKYPLTADLQYVSSFPKLETLILQHPQCAGPSQPIVDLIKRSYDTAREKHPNLKTPNILIVVVNWKSVRKS